MRIRLENVSRWYGRVAALRELSLEVEPGEMVVLLGPSGCGKSTTLRLVAGLEEASEGEIYIGDRRVNDVPPQQRDVAMVFQNYALYPHMTVAGNIGYPLRVRKVPEEKRSSEVRRVADPLGLGELLERYPRQLSGGQRQRVALARAIIRQPVAFLMDEPLSNLDAGLRLQMRAELKHLQRELGITTLYVTHDHDEAMTLAYRIALLQNGRLQQFGTPLELYRKPVNQFVAGFLGTPSMNFLQGRLEGQGAVGAFRFEGGAIPLSPAQTRAAGAVRSLVLGFRPQEAEVVPLVSATVRGSIYVSEEMGSEVVLLLSCGQQRVTVTAAADFRAAIGDKLGIRIPPSALHLFDGESGKTLVSGTG